MTQANPHNLNKKDLAKYYRQKCVNILEKITKSCFRMFRDETTTKEHFVERFLILKGKLDALKDVHLDTEYHREMRKYVENVGHILQGNFDLEAMRGPHMTQLNRLQKLRSTSSYKKQKHKKGVADIDIGEGF